MAGSMMRGHLRAGLSRFVAHSRRTKKESGHTSDPLATARVTTSDGRVIFVDPGDPRGLKLMATSGNANPPSLAAWKALVGEREWDLVIDVGANYGEMLLNLEPAPSRIMIAVEANWRIATYLSSSVRANRFPVTVFVGDLGSQHREIVPDLMVRPVVRVS